MSDQQPLAVLPTPPSRRGSLSTLSARSLHREIRRNAALAGGIEAIAERAIDEGEATQEQLEHLGDLSRQVREDLTSMAVAVAEMAGTSGGESS
ncbi:hypothetical protein NFH98_20890 [Halomonas sp. H33-56]|uniref:hypothetical protein n=1 Tax=Halomonas sp. H33-56 TaxID=2950873 RepID=UPI0032E044D7